jgi:hypothetical protein
VFSFHSIILPKTQQPIFEKNPKKEKKEKEKSWLVHTQG